MKPTISGCLIALVLFAIASCNGNSGGNKGDEENTSKGNLNIAQVGWLIGTWKGSMPEGASYEIWNKENDSCLSGRSFLVRGKDTIPMESMKLKQAGKDLLYIPTVNGQQPTTFTLSSTSAEDIVFENPAHNFPQKITYRHITPDSLFAAISGLMGGQAHTENFPMSRVK